MKSFGFLQIITLLLLPYVVFGLINPSTDVVVSATWQRSRSLIQYLLNSPPLRFDFWRDVVRVPADRLATFTKAEMDDIKKKHPEISDIMTNIEGNAKAVAASIKIMQEDLFNSNHNSLADSSSKQSSMKNLDWEEFERLLQAQYDLVLEELHGLLPDSLPEDQDERDNERVKSIVLLLDKVEDAFVRVCTKWDVPEDKIRQHFDPIKAPLAKTLSTLAKLRDEHPVLFDLAAWSIVMALLPESWFAAPLLRIVGFGRFGPIKGSAAAWFQSYFWRGAISAGSWFSMLQRAAMKWVPGIIITGIRALYALILAHLTGHVHVA